MPDAGLLGRSHHDRDRKLMDIPVGTVKTRCRMALCRLWDLMQKRGLDPRIDGPRRAWLNAP